MGYTATGQPIGITFISRPFQEDMLLKIGYAFEQETKARKLLIISNSKVKQHTMLKKANYPSKKILFEG
jgi:hypothetical protein